MAAPRRNGIRCEACNKEVKVCPHCKARLHPDTAFSRWMRYLDYPNSNSQASNHNLDYVWFRYYDNWFITIEEKTHGKEYDLEKRGDVSQIQSHGLIKQMLSAASGGLYDISFADWSRTNEQVFYKGHYVITFENTTPDDGWMKINGEAHSRYDLRYLLWRGVLKYDITEGDLYVGGIPGMFT